MWSFRTICLCIAVLAVALAPNSADARRYCVRCCCSSELASLRAANGVLKDRLQKCDCQSNTLQSELEDANRQLDQATHNAAICDVDRQWLVRVNDDLRNRMNENERIYLLQTGFWQYQLADARREAIGAVREMAANKHPCCSNCNSPVIAHAPIVTNTPISTPLSTSPLASEPQLSSPQGSAPQSTPISSFPQLANPNSTTPLATLPQMTNPQMTNPQTSNPQTSNPQTSNPQNSNPQTSNPQSNSPFASSPQSSQPQSISPLANVPQFANPQTSSPAAAAGGGGAAAGGAGGSGGSGGGLLGGLLGGLAGIPF